MEFKRLFKIWKTTNEMKNSNAIVIFSGESNFPFRIIKRKNVPLK